MKYIRFEDVFNDYTIRDSLEQCKKGTYWKNSVILYDMYSEYNLYDLLEQLYSNTFEFDPLYHTTIMERGKERLICSLTIKDRVVQKCLNQNFILPIFRPKLIYDNCASLKDRGVDFALNRMKAHLQHADKIYNRNFFIAKLDLKSYFDTIPHNYMASIVDRYTYDKRLMTIIYKILYQYQLDEYVHNGDNLPFGIGLGGEVPQSFGILCLNEMDHMIKEYYRIPYMVRYMDDIIMIHPDYNYLASVIDCLSKYLHSLNMRFNTNKTVILHSSEGVKFLKFHFYFGKNIGEIYLLPEKKSIKREKRKIRAMFDLYRDNKILDVADIKQSYSSYRGHISRGDSFNIINVLDQLFEELSPTEEEMEDILYSRMNAGVRHRN